jgi:serine/threonine protein kinase
MTEPGQTPLTPPHPDEPAVPPWAPKPRESPAEQEPETAARTIPPPAPGEPNPPDLAETMKLPRVRRPGTGAPTSPPFGTPPPDSPGVAVTMRLPRVQQPVQTPPPAPAPPAPATAAPATSDVAMTMRLTPLQPPAAPPPQAPPMTTPLAPADRYIGKYRIKGELGRGGMGTVYLAEQPGLGREVAIKELIQSAAADPVALKRFMQEAQVMARTSHPNLVQVHDIELMGTANYLVLEYVRGKSLRDRMNANAIPLPQSFAIMHGVLQALDYAHKHAIVHRDMKPENVLISDEGAVKVADFGIARLTDDSGVGNTATKTGTTVGTPQYMSPEQVSSSKVDGRSDLYSAGIMFYELIVGQPPFTASEADGPFTLMAKHVQAPPMPPSVRKPGLDIALEEVILKSLAKRPEDRYQSGREFDDAISSVADRLCPGWQRSLEPGADLSRMVPGAAASGVAPATPIGIAIAQPAQAIPIQAVYNPTPPVKPVAKKTAGCLGVLLGTLSLASLLVVLIGLNSAN